MPKAAFSDEAAFYLRIWTLHKSRAFVGLEKTLQMFTSFTHCHSRKHMSNFSLPGRQSRRNPSGQTQKWLWLQMTMDLQWDFTLFQPGGTSLDYHRASATRCWIGRMGTSLGHQGHLTQPPPTKKLLLGIFNKNVLIFNRRQEGY